MSMSPIGDHGAGQAVTLGQLRHATVLFADLSDYTALVEQHRGNLAAIARIAERLERAAREIVSRHRGIVNEIRGDGIVALFGLPDSDEFDVRDAVEAALEINAAVGELTPGQPGEQWQRLRTHSGIHAGLVLVQRASHDLRLYRVTGSAMNVAAFLSNLAQPGEVLVSAESLRACRGRYLTAPHAPVVMAGLRDPLAVEVVSGHSDGNWRLADARRGWATFVGRRDVLGALDSALRSTLDGAMRIVAITGIAGIGKSRVAEEFLNRTYATPVRLLRGHCSSGGQAAPLQPFRHVLGALLDLDAATLAAGSERAATALATHFPSLAEHLDALCRILVLEREDPTSAGSTDGEAVVRGLVAALVEAATRQPLVILVDDWQWADEACSRVVTTLAKRGAQAPIMLLLTSRDSDLRLGRRAADLALPLTGLASEEARAAVEGLLPGTPDLGHVDAILTRAGGVPLYIEELCRAEPQWPLEPTALQHDDLSGPPHWLSRLIEKRILALTQPARDLVSRAAVVGRQVPRWLLERLLGDAPAPTVLHELAEAALVFADDEQGLLEFKHGITRELVYGLVEFARRIDLHAEIARVLEVHGDALPPAERIEALAYHHERAEQFALAIDYAERAGDNARALSSLDRARLHYQAALELLDRVEQNAAARDRRAAVSGKWAQVCMYRPAQGQIAPLTQQIEQAEAVGDVAGAARARYYLGYIIYALGRHAEAQAIFARALQSADPLRMTRLDAEIVGAIGHSAMACNDPVRAEQYLDRAIDYWRVQSSRELPVGHAYSLTCKAMLRADRGEFALGEALIADAHALIEGHEHQIEGSITAIHSAMLVWQGRWDDAVAMAERARVIGQRVAGPYIFAMANTVASYARWMKSGNFEHVAALQLATEWLEHWGIGLFVSLNYGWLVEMMAACGRIDEALDYLGRLEQERGAVGETIGAPPAYRALARAAARMPDRLPASFTHYLARARALARARLSPLHDVLNDLCEAEICEATGDIERARRLATDCVAAFAARDMPWHAARAGAFVHGETGGSGEAMLVAPG